MVTIFNYQKQSVQEELSSIVGKLTALGKGILVSDESTNELNYRLRNNVIVPSEENRCAYRQLLFSTNGEIFEYISGVVVTHQTLYLKTGKDIRLVQLLKDRQLLVGIHVDQGTVPLLGSKEGESTTEGLECLAERCNEYKKDGCSFTKWCSFFKIRKDSPSYQAIMDNANVLARFASISQSQLLVPIIEVQISSDDSDHTIGRTQKVAETIFAAIFKLLNDHHVFLEGLVLRTNYISAGEFCKAKNTIEKIAFVTVQTLRRTVPTAVPGIFFIEGKGTEEEITYQLNAINNVRLLRPWVLSFAFSRALQTSVIRVWSGKCENTIEAQDELLMRCQANSLASLGKYTGLLAPSTGCYGLTVAVEKDLPFPCRRKLNYSCNT